MNELKRYKANRIQSVGTNWFAYANRYVYLASEADAALKAKDAEIEGLRLRIAVAEKYHEINANLELIGEGDRLACCKMSRILTMPINELQAFLREHPEYKESSNES